MLLSCVFCILYTPLYTYFWGVLCRSLCLENTLKNGTRRRTNFSASTNCRCCVYVSSIRREKLLHDRQFFPTHFKTRFILLAEFFYAELCMIYIYIIVTSHRYIVLLFCASIPFLVPYCVKREKKERKKNKRKELNMSFLKVVVQRVCGNILTYKPWCYMELF